MNNYEVFSLFPVPVYKTNIEREFSKQEHDEFDAIISKDLEEKTPQKWKEITTDKYLLKRKPLLTIKSFIEQHLKEFSTTVLGINENEASCDITQSWLNVYPPTAFNPVHHHINSIISGVFYINCLEYSGEKRDGINFTNSAHEIARDIELPIAHSTIFSDKISNVSVATGDLVLFPSSVRHSVNINETPDQTRISLAFNAFAFGKLLQVGDDTSELILKQGK